MTRSSRRPALKTSGYAMGSHRGRGLLAKGCGRYPTLFAASPYRFDNNLLPPTPQFLWRETGPIKWYLDHRYAFVHMDVRGTGRSDGEYRFLDSKEQTDFFDVIEWIALQPWSDGKIWRNWAVLLRDDAVVHGSAEAAAPRLHCPIRRADRCLHRHRLFGRYPQQVHEYLVQWRATAA